jgi:Holliday junction DNA helicase RuvA
MIAHVRGIVAERGSDHVVVDVHGIGYRLTVPSSADVPARGQDVELRTSMVVREDSMTLYGFSDPAAQQLFELLMSASGVGPKLAMAVLSTHRPSTVRTAIAAADLDLLVAVPGIGKKSAQKLVLELKDKIGSLDAPDIDLSGGGANGSGADGDGAVADTREALLQLGYGPSEVAVTLSNLDRDGDASTLLRRALQAIGSHQ